MKTALITGGSSGIGFAFAKKILAENYAVILLARDEANLVNAKQELNKKFPDACVDYVIADVSDKFSLIHATEKIAKVNWFKEFDLVVHSAGILRLADLNNAVLNLAVVMQINFHGTANVIDIIVPCMAKKSNLIVISSVAGLVKLPGGYSVYGTSKAAQAFYCEAIREDLLVRGIRLMMVYPSVINTPMVTIFGNSLPEICRLKPWVEASTTVSIFYKDMKNNRREFFISLSDRVMIKISQIAPRTFSRFLKIWIRTAVK